jgi:hypothetical protein
MAAFVYLSVLPSDCDVVDYPNGERAVVARGEGTTHAEAWTPELAASAARASVADPARAARQQAAHREWAEQLDRALDASTSITHSRMIREEFLRENLEPPLDGAVTASEPDGRPRVLEGRWWRARIESDGAGFEAWLADAEESYPRAAVAHALSEVSDGGWTIRHISEERRAVHDDEGSRTVVVSAWILLESGGVPVTC